MDYRTKTIVEISNEFKMSEAYNECLTKENEEQRVELKEMKAKYDEHVVASNNTITKLRNEIEDLRAELESLKGVGK